MLFLLWLLFTPSQSYGLVIPPSSTATGTTGTAELATFVATPDAENGAQIILGQRKGLTCNYVGGDGDSPLISPSAYACTSSDSSGNWKCCDETGCEYHCNICVDYDDDKCGALGIRDCESKDTSVLFCPSGTPACIRYSGSASPGDTSTVYSLGCETTHETDSTIKTGTRGARMIKKRADTVEVNAVQERSKASSQTNVAETEPSVVKRSNDDGKLDSGDIIAIVIPSVAILVAIAVGWWEKQQVAWCLTCGLCGNRRSERNQSLWKSAWKKLRCWGR